MQQETHFHHQSQQHIIVNTLSGILGRLGLF